MTAAGCISDAAQFISGRGDYADCRRKYVREEVLDETFAALLDKLHFDEEVLAWVRDALKASHAASQLFVRQPLHEKKRLLNLVLSNCEWKRGEVRAALRQPFDLLSETVAAVATEEASGAKLSTGHPVWLGFLEAFRTFCLAPSAESRVLMKEIEVSGHAMGQA
ncbi:hypothetical protein EH240_05785 [Mesorhizobium tamadayense]|uniref:Uncharacterized protein n=1 Tax=Mesorhizobium tamadayense TaxID=425306 RepID=A0A3P3G3G8_9HYPH|nr:hypothetical protein [Mesorhizobium tamadayense]RRI05401.1 hypothetical protein EH240_05785 [Mesorhizobium tamadayense]